MDPSQEMYAGRNETSALGTYAVLFAGLMLALVAGPVFLAAGVAMMGLLVALGPLIGLTIATGMVLSSMAPFLGLGLAALVAREFFASSDEY